MTSRRFGEPSLFWEQLAREHSDDLARYGFDSIKRRQALRYFTWRWSWGSVHRSEQMRFLLAHTSPQVLVRTLLEPAGLSGRGWDGSAWPRRDRWLYVFATRLLWEYARKHDPRDVLSLSEPELGGPLPVFHSGRLISQDLANSALEVSAVHRAVAGMEVRSILEVGAGYGRTAYVLLNLYPGASYVVVDIEPALQIARTYLSHLFPDAQLHFLSPEDALSLEAGSVDLALSISSLHEMTSQQVARYLGLFDRVAAGGVVYLKQWARWINPEDNVTMMFDEYPIPPSWRCVLDEPAPVQTGFRQAAWRIP